MIKFTTSKKLKSKSVDLKNWLNPDLDLRTIGQNPNAPPWNSKRDPIPKNDRQSFHKSLH